MFTTTTARKERLMPNIDAGLLRRLATTQRRYRDVLARQIAEQRLDEVERRVQHERERRGMEPITTDTGAVIGWVRTRPQSPGDR